MKKTSKTTQTFWQKILAWSIALVAVIVVVSYLSMMSYGQRMLDLNLKQLDLAEASLIYDANGREVERIYLENRQSIPLAEIPELLVDTFVLVEDRRFREHNGIDLKSLGRAIVADIRHQSLNEGGSTITQQLAKNLFLDFDKTFSRKAAELAIAFALESRYSKNEILELYVNRIYFGRGTYGVKSAAKLYFQKELSELLPWEIAALVAIPKAPSYYNPIDDPMRAKQRRQTILQLMRQQGLISPAEYDEAILAEYALQEQSTAINGASFTDYALQEVKHLTELTQEDLFADGYHIYTTLNPQVQQEIEKAFADPQWFPPDGSERKSQGAMVVLDHRTGAIQGMSGGRQYVQKGLHRVMVPRQPGSAIKPLIVYAPALETGNWHPYSKLVDRPLDFSDYQPKNYDLRYEGEVTMLEAIRVSKNVPAVWLLDEIGIETGMQFMDKLGIPLDREDRNLSSALGGLTFGMTPLELAQGYAVFANQGIQLQPYLIERIENSKGEVVYQHELQPQRVLSEQSAYYMTRMLEEVVQSGTGTAAQLNRPVAGKTGSTEHSLEGVNESRGYRDIWFAGYTPEWTAAVWMGFDETDEQHYIREDSRYPARLFKEVMDKTLENVPVRDFVKPEGVEELMSPPKPPLEVEAEYQENSRAVVISWLRTETQIPEDNGIYRVYRKAENESSFTMLQQTSDTDLRDRTVLPGVSYTYYVTYVERNWELESEPSSRTTVQTPQLSRRNPLEMLRDWFR